MVLVDPTKNRNRLKSVLALLSIVWVVGGSSPAVAGSVQSSECFPKNADPSWPISSIYLHGLFTAKGPDTLGFRALEAANRKKIEKFAKDHQIRIAVPTSTKFDRGGKWREWNKVPLKTIEAQARKACDGAPLAKERSLIGFSNGANRASEIAQMDCKTTAAYTKIMILGQSSQSRAGRCKNQTVHRRAHEFPKQAFLEDYLDDVIRANRSRTRGSTKPRRDDVVR